MTEEQRFGIIIVLIRAVLSAHECACLMTTSVSYVHLEEQLVSSSHCCKELQRLQTKRRRDTNSSPGSFHSHLSASFHIANMRFQMFVPFSQTGWPSKSSEFSHLFTSLSFNMTSVNRAAFCFSYHCYTEFSRVWIKQFNNSDSDSSSVRVSVVNNEIWNVPIVNKYQTAGRVRTSWI